MKETGLVKIARRDNVALVVARQNSGLCQGMAFSLGDRIIETGHPEAYDQVSLFKLVSCGPGVWQICATRDLALGCEDDDGEAQLLPRLVDGGRKYNPATVCTLQRGEPSVFGGRQERASLRFGPRRYLHSDEMLDNEGLVRIGMVPVEQFAEVATFEVAEVPLPETDPTQLRPLVFTESLNGPDAPLELIEEQQLPVFRQSMNYLERV